MKKTTKKRSDINAMTDRERVLMNIASELASQLATLSLYPQVREILKQRGGPWVELKYMAKAAEYKKGDLVLCSANRRVNPWIISYVEEIYWNLDEGLHMLLKEVVGERLCNYTNESYHIIHGIDETLLLNGLRYKIRQLVLKVFAKEDDYSHRFREIEFTNIYPNMAIVWIGEVFGGLGKKTKPYGVEITFDNKTGYDSIREQLLAGGYTKREFEEWKEGEQAHPQTGLVCITRDDLVSELALAGIELQTPKPEDIPNESHLGHNGSPDQQS